MMGLQWNLLPKLVVVMECTEHNAIDLYTELTQELYKTMKTGLTNRIASIGFEDVSEYCWKIDAEPNSLIPQLTFGINFNNKEYSRVLDIGPSNEEKKLSKEFRRFWGSKSKLRRFKDGSIVETVHWGDVPEMQRCHITYFILLHILNRHHKLPKSCLQFYGNQFDSLLALSGLNFPTLSQKLVPAVHSLSEQLMSLRNIPISIQSVEVVHPVLRNCSVTSPLLNSDSSARFNFEQIPVIVILQSNSGWPDNVGAVRRIKTALYLRIIARLHDLTCKVAEDFMDVVFEGFTFRLKLFCNREIQALAASGTAEEKAMRLDLIERPLHAAALTKVHRAHSSFGYAVRLAKLWVSYHLLSSCVSDELVELLVAHTYCDGNIRDAPGSAFSGFFRFLMLIASHDWINLPLVVDVDGSIGSDQLREIDASFKKTRSVVSQSLFVASSTDLTSRIWVTPKCSEVSAKLIQYARSSAYMFLQLLKSHTISSANWKSIFKTPTEGIHALIVTKAHKPGSLAFIPDVNSWSQSHCVVEAPHLATRKQKYEATNQIGFSVLRKYMEVLHSRYGAIVRFSVCDPASVIAVTWSAFLAEQPQFRVLQVIDEIKDLGEGFVERVHYNKIQLERDGFML